ncbi:hypothetical protein ACIQB5_51330 [Streptomyces sp. NPDC088560]|uniref:hypothetical protein n=1 Tax=Streptomyces sp. NPDC088560 TaxID=3365868 RepID=UPI0037FD93CD
MLDHGTVDAITYKVLTGLKNIRIFTQDEVKEAIRHHGRQVHASENDAEAILKDFHALRYMADTGIVQHGEPQWQLAEMAYRFIQDTEKRVTRIAAAAQLQPASIASQNGTTSASTPTSIATSTRRNSPTRR